MNARLHNDAQVAQIAGSIKEFGFNNPILIDPDNGLIAGHGRLMAARKLGLENVPCIRLGHLSDTQKKAYILADNKIALNAEWDIEILNSELDSLMELDFDIDIAGFNLDEVEELKNSINEEQNEGEEKESVLDRLDICIDEPRTKVEKGDRWALDRHILICSDVINNWSEWVDELSGEDTLFIPYAGIYAPLAKKAEQHKLVIVQPDTYIAGLIIDRYIDVHGSDLVNKL